MTGGRWIRTVLALPLVLAITALDCEWDKDQDFFFPGEDVLTPPDRTAPQITNMQPSDDIEIFHDENLVFEANDPTVDGFPGSGVDAAGVRAMMNGTSLPVTNDGSTFTIGPVAPAFDGDTRPITVDVEVPDRAGNLATATFGFTWDPEAPVIDVTEAPESGIETDAESFTFRFGGSILDPHLLDATFGVFQVGDDGECGTADDQPWPEGTEGGQVSQNSFDLGSSFDFSFDAFNGVPADGEPRTVTYCGRFTAFDSARDKTGAENPNTGTEILSTDFTWLPPEPMVTTGLIVGGWTFTYDPLSSTCPGDDPNDPPFTVDAAITSPAANRLDVTFPDAPAPIRLVLNPDGTASGETGRVSAFEGFDANEMWEGQFTIDGEVSARFASHVDFFDTTSGARFCERDFEVEGALLGQ